MVITITDFSEQNSSFCTLSVCLLIATDFYWLYWLSTQINIYNKLYTLLFVHTSLQMLRYQQELESAARVPLPDGDDDDDL